MRRFWGAGINQNIPAPSPSLIHTGMPFAEVQFWGKDVQSLDDISVLCAWLETEARLGTFEGKRHDLYSIFAG